MSDYVLAIDQGTTSTRAMVFDRAARVVSTGQLSHRQIFPRPGWVEHDPTEIWDKVRESVAIALSRGRIDRRDLAAVGVTNQRETVVVWNRLTGEPVHPAIVWQDTRTQGLVDELAAGGGLDRFRDITGLPLATYFSGPKIAWILDNVAGAREAAEVGDLLAGTMDSWVVWNLTGGVDGGVHVTDVTNASRTSLMDLSTLEWSPSVCADLRIPPRMLPEIKPSSAVYGIGRSGGLLAGVPVAGALGDQQAAMLGQGCVSSGDLKCTYGTGNFVLMNTGEERIRSSHGLLTTVAYQLSDEAPVYALEGSIAVTGSLVQWLRDGLGIIANADEVEPLAAAAADNGGVYIVPAFSGLFAPHWRPDARGVVTGLTRYASRHHLARAALEATAFQTREVIEAMRADAPDPITRLRVDGGMVGNELLMQFQADQLDMEVVRPEMAETTALGAAFAAGIAVGTWSGLQEVSNLGVPGRRWRPAMDEPTRERRFRLWKKAVARSLDWVDDDGR